ncbi:MAG: nucleotide exchange factor GrpE [Thermoleophilia bacterium]|nr:nucleotide exchange factor GrpE [Thermoleophilia bacterium]
MTHDPTDPRTETAEPSPVDDGAAPAASTEEAAEGASTGHADEIARLEGERDAYLDALQRLKAEFDNFRKRNDRDRQMISVGATREVVRDLLPVMDNLERAVAALGDQGEGIVAGLEMVRGQLAALLTGHGVEEIPASGEAFDPTVHEAIASVPSPHHDEGAIIEVVEKGYRHSEHVLRPTRVVIAAARPPAASPAGE